MRKKFRSVLYVNYSPYENSGKLLDYLLERFEIVYLFSIGFHPLGSKQKTNKIVIYKKGIVSREINMHYLAVNNKLVVLLIPVRSTLNLIQMLWHVTQIVKSDGKIDVMFSVNAFTAWGGIFFKRLGLVKKTIFWVWDYYPMNHPDFIVQIMRWMYWQFDKAATFSDRVVYLNNRLADVRVKAGLIKKGTYPLVAIGSEIFVTKPKKLKKRSLKIGFIGVLKKSQGLDLLIDVSKLLKKELPNVSFEVIGSGPDADYFKKKAKKVQAPIKFHGYVDDETFPKILAKCAIGIAPYLPDDSNLSFYGDPGKVKRYLSHGLPVVITDVFEFSKELEHSKAGIIIDYYDH